MRDVAMVGSVIELQGARKYDLGAMQIDCNLLQCLSCDPADVALEAQPAGTVDTMGDSSIAILTGGTHSESQFQLLQSENTCNMDIFEWNIMTSAQIQNMIIFMTFGTEVLAHILTACWCYGICEKPSVIHMKSRQLRPVISATFSKDAADVLLIASMAPFGIRFSFQSSSISIVTDVCGERCAFLLKVTKRVKLVQHC